MQLIENYICCIIINYNIKKDLSPGYNVKRRLARANEHDAKTFLKKIDTELSK